MLLLMLLINYIFFKMYSIDRYNKGKITYEEPNLSQLEDFIYFMPDVPYLIKIVHNAWYKSCHNDTCHLEISKALVTIAEHY